MLKARPRLVLASGSAARRNILKAAGVDVVVRPVPVNEAEVKTRMRAQGASAGQTALELARLKAMASARSTDGAGEEIIIGADQLLVCEDEWLDKPAHLAQAEQHLRFLRGRTHILHTAVCCVRDGQEVWHHQALPCLTMRPFSDDFLARYLAEEGEHIVHCVGCYRLEAMGAQLFEHMDGEYSAILGLPMLALLAFLRDAGLLMA